MKTIVFMILGPPQMSVQQRFDTAEHCQVLAIIPRDRNRRSDGVLERDR